MDKRDIPGKFLPFRYYLVKGLLFCTHHIIVLGPNSLNSDFLKREIQMSIQRWYTETIPSIIMVIEPNLAKEWLKNIEKVRLPFINLLLKWCPQLSYSEANNINNIQHLLKQRSRRGLIGDLLSIKNPFQTIRAILAQEIKFTRYFSKS